MKFWIYRSKTEWTIENEHFLERYPDKAYLFTHLYICYDKPMAYPIPDSTRYVELPNYWCEDVKPGELIELERK